MKGTFVEDPKPRKIELAQALIDAKQWKETDIAWIAGIIEGEGYIESPDRRERSLRIQVKMTDQDVIERIFALLDLGRILGPYRDGEQGHKPIWHWYVTGLDAYALLVMILPWLCERRGQRAREGMDLYLQQPLPPQLRSRCKRGHEYSPENTKYWPGQPNYRVCISCHEIDATNSRQKAKEKRAATKLMPGG